MRGGIAAATRRAGAGGILVSHRRFDDIPVVRGPMSAGSIEAASVVIWIVPRWKT